MRFQTEMQEIAFELETKNGYNILQCAYCDSGRVLTMEELEHLADAHYQKIDMSDGIYVVNIGGYIGESVRNEIVYAQYRGKEVVYHENK